MSTQTLTQCEVELLKWLASNLFSVVCCGTAHSLLEIASQYLVAIKVGHKFGKRNHFHLLPIYSLAADSSLVPRPSTPPIFGSLQYKLLHASDQKLEVACDSDKPCLSEDMHLMYHYPFWYTSAKTAPMEDVYGFIPSSVMWFIQ